MYHIHLVHVVDGHPDLQNDVFYLMRREFDVFLNTFSHCDSLKTLHHKKGFNFSLIKVVCLYEAVMTRQQSHNPEFCSSFDRVLVIHVVVLVENMFDSAFMPIA